MVARKKPSRKIEFFGGGPIVGVLNQDGSLIQLSNVQHVPRDQYERESERRPRRILRSFTIESVLLTSAPWVEPAPSDDWTELSDVQQSIIRFLARQARGKTFTQDEILNGAHGVHNKGAHRKELRALADAGTVRRMGPRGGMRLVSLPDRVPRDLTMHDSWRSS